MSTSEACRYDSEMIHDFLHHLLWDLRATHFEQVAEAGTVNNELIHQLASFSRKYHCSLLPIMKIDAKGASQSQVAEVIAMVRKMYTNQLAGWIANLEALRELFALAIRCSQHDIRDGHVPTQMIRVLDHLDQNGPSDGDRAQG